MNATAKKTARGTAKFSKAARAAKRKTKPEDEPKVRTVESALQMAQRTMCLVLTFTALGNRRKVANSQVEVAADKDWIAVSKRLLDSDEFDAVKSLDGEIRRYIANTALPGLLKQGVYLLPTELVEPVTAKLREFDIQRRVLVKKFVAEYAELVHQAQVRLDKLFDPADYMDPAHVEGCFRLRWQLIQFTTPASLEQISRELYEQEKAKAEAQWAEARETIQQMLRADMAELVEHLVDRLSTDEKGNKKTFFDSSVTKVQSFLQVFDARNITDDAQLQTLVSEAKKIISDVNPKRLRNSENLREHVRDGFAKIREALDPLIVNKPKRGITFEEV